MRGIALAAASGWVDERQRLSGGDRRSWRHNTAPHCLLTRSGLERGCGGLAGRCEAGQVRPGSCGSLITLQRSLALG